MFDRAAILRSAHATARHRVSAYRAAGTFGLAGLTYRKFFASALRSAWRLAKDRAEDQAYEASLADLPRSHPRRLAAEERYDVADVLADQAGDAHRAIVEDICRRPARTIDGLAFKARVSLKHEDNRLAELVTSIMDDILAMGGADA